MGGGRSVLGCCGSKVEDAGGSAAYRLGAERDATESKIPRAGWCPASRLPSPRSLGGVYLIRAYLTPPVKLLASVFFFPEPMRGAKRSATRGFSRKEIPDLPHGHARRSS